MTKQELKMIEDIAKVIMDNVDARIQKLEDDNAERINDLYSKIHNLEVKNKIVEDWHKIGIIKKGDMVKIQSLRIEKLEKDKIMLT